MGKFVKIRNEEELRKLMELFQKRDWYWMEGQAPLDYAPNVDFPYYVRAENPIIYRGVLPDWGNLVSYETVKRGEKKKVEKKKVVRDGFFSSRDTSFPDFLDGGLVDYLCSSVDYLIIKKWELLKEHFNPKKTRQWNILPWEMPKNSMKTAGGSLLILFLKLVWQIRMSFLKK
jgi:hypothetical protein